MSDTVHTILRSASQFLSGTMLSRITGLLRDIAMAFAFGTHASVAAFLVAFRFSHLFRRLFGEGALQSAFTPQFEKLRHLSSEQASHFFRDLSLLLSVFLTVLIVFSMGLLGLSLTFGDFSEGNREILQLTITMMPSLLFICLFGLNAALLQCEKSYFIPGMAPVAFNLVWIVGVVCLWHLQPDIAMPYLAVFLNLACFAQWIVTVPRVWEILQQCDLKSFWSGINLASKDLKNFCKPLALGILGVGASQINSALDAVFARYASSEGPAYLWYALRIQQLPLALIGIAISGALLPPLSRAIKAGDLEKCRLFLNFALRKSLLLMIPIAVGIIAVGEKAIALLYARGDFDSSSVHYTTQCLWGYGFGLVPMALVLIMAPAFYAQENYRLPTLASLVAVICNMIFNFIAVVVFKSGAWGIACATSLSSWINFFILAYVLSQNLGDYAKGVWWPFSAKIVASTFAGLMAVVVFGLGSGNHPPTGFADQFMDFAQSTTLFLLVTLGTAWLLKIDWRL